MIEKSNLKINFIQDNFFHIFYSKQYNLTISVYKKKLDKDVMEKFLHYANQPNSTEYLDFWTDEKLITLIKEDRYLFSEIYNLNSKKTVGFVLNKKFLNSNGIKIEFGITTTTNIDTYKTFLIYLYFLQEYIKHVGIKYIEFYTRDSNRFFNKIAINSGFQCVDTEITEFKNNIYRYYA